MKEETTSKLLAKMLWDSINKKIKLNSKSELIRNYHMALVNENVIDMGTKKIHVDFIEGSDGLSEGAIELRQNLLKFSKNVEDWKSFIFSFDKNFGKRPLQPQVFNYPLPVAVKDEEIIGFLDKLIFAVNTPNEGELDDVLKREVGNYFTLLTTDLQSAYVMNEMINWFKREDNVWLSSEEAKKLFLNKTQILMESIRVNEISIDYQKQLKKDLMELEFNTEAIQVMTEKLRPLLLESNSSSVIIGTESPQHTAVKLVAAIKTFPEFKCDDSFLVTSSKRLEDKMEMEKFKGCLELKKDSHTLLVIVCEGEGSAHAKYANLLPERRKDNKINKIVIICPDKTAYVTDKTAYMTDEIKYKDLTDEFKQNILSLKISFQLKKGLSQQELEDNKITVGELIGHKPEEIIDLRSIQELMTGKEIKIPSFDDTTHFEELMYIKRQLKFPFHDKFEDEIATSLNCTLDQLHMECQICPDGKIEWLAQQGKRQNEIWEKIKDVANQSTLSGLIDEDNHMKGDGKEKSIVIISGVAGTGKSTLLSHYYEEIKKAKPSHWVIRINLSDHNDEILKLNVMPSNVVDFLVNQLNVIDDKSSFSRSLLRNRLEKGDRIVFLFDGFDEINETCQEKVIQLMKAITKEKSSQLFVTTRPHMLDDLQFQLSQLAFSLENLSENDQINHLASYWRKELNLSGDNDGSLQQFAKLLIKRVSETLKDEDQSFIGVPLQCRILAECFQSEIEAIIRKDRNQPNAEITPDGKIFDLAPLYYRLMETKRAVFLEKQTKNLLTFSDEKEFLYDSINMMARRIECYLTKLAIQVIFQNRKTQDKKIVNLLRSSSSHQQSESEMVEEENVIAKHALKYGLTFQRGEENKKVEFLHRTYAEYLVARHLYEGFIIDDKKHNKLLENESVRRLIIEMMADNVTYEGVKVFFNSMLKEIVDDDKQWRKNIKKELLPERLKMFTTEWKSATENASKSLENAIKKKNGNIFKFLCDCFDASKFTSNEFRFIMKNTSLFKGSNALRIRTFQHFSEQNSQLFERFIKYYCDNQVDDDEVSAIINSMLGSLLPFSFSDRNREEKIKIVGLVNNLMVKNCKKN